MLDNETTIDQLIPPEEEGNQVNNKVIVGALDNFIEIIETNEENLTNKELAHMLKLVLKLVWQLWEAVMMRNSISRDDVNGMYQ